MTESRDISLGVIGLSPGNGHPYSWSAIINGYDAELMRECPFPAIPEYLSHQQWPDARVSGATVTHIHAPEVGAADAIARSTFIQRVCEIEELSEAVDAVLLARDDAEHHVEFASRALRLGKPVYVDKPIALSRVDLEQLLGLQQVDGLIFTCSALTFSPEFERLRRFSPNEVSQVRSTAPKDWARYGMHTIEPVVDALWARIRGQDWRAQKLSHKPSVMSVLYEDGLAIEFACTGRAESAFEVEVTLSDKMRVTLVHQNTFVAFKSALESFIGGIRAEKSLTDMAMVAHCVDLLAAGRGDA